MMSSYRFDHPRSPCYSMMVTPRFRRLIITLMGLFAASLMVFLFLFPSPDLSEEHELLRRIAELKLRVQMAEEQNLGRKHDLQSLFVQFAELTRKIRAHQDPFENRDKSLLSMEAEALFQNANWTYDLSLPSLHNSLPHTIDHPDSFVPAFKISQARPHVSTVLGIPTVRRTHQSYLETTLRSIIDNMEEEERTDSLIVVFIAETNKEFVFEVANEIQKQFKEHLNSGLLEVISPPASFYPDMNALELTLGDDLERVQWRSKQNLDYAFLMMYAHGRGTFYVQLEDDILTKPKFVTTMKEYALEKIAVRDRWLVIDYCQLGFIGKMFKGSNLPLLVQFFIMFYNDKPVDWLLDNFIQTKVCKLDDDNKKCRKSKQELWIHYKPSLFQHIGTHSSLKGKVQKLKDKQFGKVQLFSPHKNPPATVHSDIKNYKHYSLSKAYRGETFFWGLVPQVGDELSFRFTPPVRLESIRIASGNAEHPSDRFEPASTIEVSVDGENFDVAAHFDANGLAVAEMDPNEPVKEAKIKVNAVKDENWVIISEMFFKPAGTK